MKQQKNLPNNRLVIFHLGFFNLNDIVEINKYRVVYVPSQGQFKYFYDLYLLLHDCPKDYLASIQFLCPIYELDEHFEKEEIALNAKKSIKDSKYVLCRMRGKVYLMNMEGTRNVLVEPFLHSREVGFVPNDDPVGVESREQHIFNFTTTFEGMAVIATKYNHNNILIDTENAEIRTDHIRKGGYEKTRNDMIEELVEKVKQKYGVELTNPLHVWNPPYETSIRYDILKKQKR